MVYFKTVHGRKYAYASKRVNGKVKSMYLGAVSPAARKSAKALPANKFNRSKFSKPKATFKFAQRSYSQPTAVGFGRKNALRVIKPKPIGNVRKIEFPTAKDFSLVDEVAVYVPSTKKRVPSDSVATEPISPEAYHERVRETHAFLTALFGGGTNIAGAGTYYSSNDSKVVGEPTSVVTASAEDKEYAKYDLALKKFLQDKCEEWGQESVGFKFNGKMYFVEKRKETG